MKLSLGTAQIGMSYGVSNRRGQPSTETAERLIGRALEAGVELFDTAPAYGDSERLIGRWLPAGSPVRIMTKASGAEGPEATVARFRHSLEDLGVAAVHALLVHDVGQLKGASGAALGRALRGLKEEGLVRKLGVSIYDPGDLEAGRDAMPVDVVELPLNVFDQRFFRDGTTERLSRDGVEVHARSAFLQGLLLMSPADLPAHLRHAEEPLRRFHHERERAGLSPIEACLGMMSLVPGLESTIVGVNSPEELDECLAAASAIGPLDYAGLELDDPTIIDPRRWQAPA